MRLTELKKKEPFCILFNISPKILTAIKEDMELCGYDQSQPIVIWETETENIIIDGHTRYEAAKQAKIEEVPTFSYAFENELDALQYAIHNQRDRRNLTEAEIMRCVEAVDKLMIVGQHLKEYPRDEQGHTIKPEDFNSKNIGQVPSHQQTAKAVGISTSKVSEVRSVLSDPEAKEKVESGTKTIHGAAQEVREKKREQKAAESPKFNRTNDESIEWAQWTWNPVSGCLHGCPYCYARDIAKRFYPPEIGFKPHFYPERLAAPKNTPIPQSDKPGERSVFVTSMGDLFGEWVPQEWIDAILKAVKEAPQWNFIFLTKNPERYLGINWPKNCWVGATADTQSRADKTLTVFSLIKQEKNQPTALFLSMEPLTEKIILPSPLPCDWLIIGGQSQTSGVPAQQPKWEWVASIDQQFPIEKFNEHKVRVYFKPKCRRREYPEIKIKRNKNEIF